MRLQHHLVVVYTKTAAESSRRRGTVNSKNGIIYENWFCTYCKTVMYVEIKYIYTYKNIFFYQFIFFFTFSSRRQETSDTINWTQNLQLTGLQSYHTNQPQATVTGLDDVQAPLREDVVTELAESFRVDGAKGWATSLTMCWIWLGGNTALFSN